MARTFRLASFRPFGLLVATLGVSLALGACATASEDPPEGVPKKLDSGSSSEDDGTDDATLEDTSAPGDATPSDTKPADATMADTTIADATSDVGGDVAKDALPGRPDAVAVDTSSPDTNPTATDTGTIIDTGTPTPDTGSLSCSEGGTCPAGATCVNDACTYGTQSCPAGEFATGFAANGTIQCSTLNTIAMQAVHARCRIYLGQRDNCDGCTGAPSYWGYGGQDSCNNGGDIWNTCGVHTLGTDSVRMFGLATNGDVNSDDKFYTGLHCVDGAATTVTTTGSCPAGSLITALNKNGTFVCTKAEAGIVEYVRSQCRLFSGWIDSCGACTTASSRSGYVGHATCSNIAGTTNNCGTYSLGGTSVRMFGLNTGGDVDGNDSFRFGFYCAAVADAATSGASCASLAFATGVDGSNVSCNPAAARADEYVRGSCSAYFGWRDSCQSCTTAPAKWGKTNSLGCTNATGSAGTDNSCANYTLDGISVPMFGLNPDGDVNDDDKFYVGLRCQ